MFGWRAYYAPFTTYDSSKYEWTDLPDEGMVGVVVFKEPPYRELVNGGDWFYLDEDGKPAASNTVWDGWVDPPDVSDDELKRGKALPDNQWEALRITMTNDKAWP